MKKATAANIMYAPCALVHSIKFTITEPRFLCLVLSIQLAVLQELSSLLHSLKLVHLDAVSLFTKFSATWTGSQKALNLMLQTKYGTQRIHGR